MANNSIFIYMTKFKYFVCLSIFFNKDLKSFKTNFNLTKKTKLREICLVVLMFSYLFL